MSARLAIVSSLFVSTAAACSRPPSSAPSTPAADSAAPAADSAAPAADSAAPASPSALAVSVPAPPSLPGDDGLPEPWRARFRLWLSKQSDPSYVRVIESHAISNALSVVLERRTDSGGVCLSGPSRLELVQEEDAPQATAELRSFGQDCCPGTACVRTPDGWNLRYLALASARNWPELSLLVPAKAKLRWQINGGEPPTVEVTRADVAAGRLRDPPSCGFIYNVPSCEGTTADASFTCRCDGGGYHVSFNWQREGEGFVLTQIDESSH